MLPVPSPILCLQMVWHSLALWGPLEGNLHPRPSNGPFISSVYWFWYTLRCCEVLFSSVLTPLAGEVVSVVDPVSNVSKVNFLCITQVCKCFHYNTSFSSVTYTEQACRLRADCSLAVLVSLTPTTPPLTPPQPGFDGSDNTKVLRTGGWVCILWVTELWLKQQGHIIQTVLPSRPQQPSHFIVVSANIEVELALGWRGWGGRRAGDKMHLFSTISTKPLLGRDAFAPLFLHLDDRSPTITAGHSEHELVMRWTSHE